MSHLHTRAVIKAAHYDRLNRQLAGILETERDFIANTANFAALLFEELPGLNWAGFYLYRHGELVLGPFQGRVACVRIKMGSGVCGTAAQNRCSLIVDNVHEFDGHIACDHASNSEIVIPLVEGDRLIGVLDLDSPVFARFDEQDKLGLERMAATFMKLTTIDIPSQKM